MNKYFCLLFITILLSIGLVAQNLKVVVDYVTADPTVHKPLIYYSPAVKLNWNDFNAQPDLENDAAAITNAGIGFRMAFHSEGDIATLNVSVSCNFSKKDSWVKDDRKTAYILNHEQHHFDIAYIQAMIFIQKLKNAKYTSKNFNTIIKQLYIDAQQSLVAMQNAYDTETKHSQLSAIQELWNKKIEYQLDMIKKL